MGTPQGGKIKIARPGPRTRLVKPPVTLPGTGLSGPEALQAADHLGDAGCIHVGKGDADLAFPRG